MAARRRVAMPPDHCAFARRVSRPAARMYREPCSVLWRGGSGDPPRTTMESMRNLKMLYRHSAAGEPAVRPSALQPLLEVLGHKRVIIEVRVRRIDAVDLFRLPRTEAGA